MAAFDSFTDRTPNHAIALGDAFEFTVHYAADAVRLILTADGQTTPPLVVEMTATDSTWSAAFTPPHIGLWFYHFEVDHNGTTTTLGAPVAGQGGAAIEQPLETGVNNYQLTVARALETVPDWYKNARFYHIFVDRFNNGNPDGHVDAPKPNTFLYGRTTDLPYYIKDAQGEIVRWDFYGGNLRGIIDKLPLLEARGINALYLSPIFEAASNHRYDTGDYHQIDAMLGGLPAFEALLEAAHARGMHVILDGVFNHVGRDSRYFNAFGHYPSSGAVQTPASNYYDWFTFTDYPHQYESWWGVADLPAINKDNDSFQRFIAGSDDAVINRWTALGVDGWRLDVADELSDDFLYQIRHALDEFQEKVLIGEVWEDASNKIAYDHRRPYLLGHMLQAVMNYPLRDLILGFANGTLAAADFIRGVLTLQANYPPATFATNFNALGTHDTERVLTKLDTRTDRLNLAVTLLYTLPGVPVLYYGDEAGLVGGKDPDNRRYYPWGRENRTVLALYETALHRRRDWAALAGDADFWPFTFGDGAGLGYIRHTDAQTAVVLLNPTDHALDVVPSVDELGYVPHEWRERIPRESVPAMSAEVREIGG